MTCTTTHPAPSSFLPWYYARQCLQRGGRVVWLSCTASGEAHVRGLLRKHTQGGQSSRKASQGDPLIYIDAAEILLGTDVGTSKGGVDARPALWRLQHVVEQTLNRLRDKEDEVCEDKPGARPSILVIVEDASMLAWQIEQVSDDTLLKGEERATGESGIDVLNEDPRIKLLRSKKRQGKVAIHRDVIGERLGAFFCDDLFQSSCVAVSRSIS
jgi:hypothetical protein